MRIAVVFTDAERTRATVTRHPSWLARLFGKRTEVTEVVFDRHASYNWRYAVDSTRVVARLGEVLDDHRRWQRVEELPVMHVTREKV